MTITARARRYGRKSRCRCCRPPIGAARALHPRGNFEGFVRAASKHKWLEVHGIEHWTHFYTDYGRDCRISSSTISSRARTTAGTKQPKVLLQVRHPGEKFVDAARTNGRSPAPMDEVLSRSGRRRPQAARRPPASAELSFEAHGRRSDLPLRAADRRRPKSPGRRAQSCSSPHRPATPIFFWCCGCSRRTSRKSCSRARSTRTRRSRRAGCGLRTASSIASARLPYRPYHTHDASSR